MGRPQGAAGHRTEVVGVRLTAEERKRLVTDRKGSLTESAYVRWVLTRAADTDPHAREADSPPLGGLGGVDWTDLDPE